MEGSSNEPFYQSRDQMDAIQVFVGALFVLIRFFVSKSLFVCATSLIMIKISRKMG